jgi:hypothetical protein
LIAAAVTAALAGRPFGFSRALPPAQKRDLLDTGAGVELPALRGRTVIPADWNLPVVLGHPNYFGRFEADVPEGAVLVIGRWGARRPQPAGTTRIETRTPVEAGAAADLLERARRLAKRLVQHRGLHVPFVPESPVIVALLPRPVETDAAAAGGVIPLARDFPEFPGGVRIELPVDSVTVGGVGYAERLEGLITGGT